MKIYIAIAAFFISNQVSSQIFKINDIYNSAFINFSHWKVLEQTERAVSDSFLLWEEKQYSESLSSNYKIQYYKADAKNMFSFLNELVQFTEKYRNENNILTFIKGVQVITVKGRNTEYIKVYDNERKINSFLNLKQLYIMRHNFIENCKKNNIAFE